jgi:hypothetical protein
VPQAEVLQLFISFRRGRGGWRESRFFQEDEDVAAIRNLKWGRRRRRREDHDVYIF